MLGHPLRSAPTCSASAGPSGTAVSAGTLARGEHGGATVCAAEPHLAPTLLRSRWPRAWHGLGARAAVGRQLGRVAARAGLALRQAAANGHRSGCFQQRLAAAGVCRSPLLSRAKCGTYRHESLALPPPRHLRIRARIFPRWCFKDEPFQNAGGVPASLSAPFAPSLRGGVSIFPGVPCIPCEGGAASRILCQAPPRAEPVKEGGHGLGLERQQVLAEGPSRTILHPAGPGKNKTRRCFG